MTYSKIVDHFLSRRLNRDNCIKGFQSSAHCVPVHTEEPLFQSLACLLFDSTRITLFRLLVEGACIRIWIH